MSSVIPCVVCGGVNYEKQSGYYICQDCDTQSQDIQEQSFEFGIDAPYLVDVDEEKVEIVSQVIDQGRKLTSWECYNLILKGLVEELIGLGAQPRLRKTAFQLWTTFLQTEQVAFFSQAEEKLPCLPVMFKNSDIEILYGIKNFRKMYLGDLSQMRSNNNKRKKSKSKPKTLSENNDKSNLETSKYQMLHLRLKQRQLARSTLDKDELQQRIKTEPNVLSNADNLEKVGSNPTAEKEVGIAFKSSARDWMDELMEKFEKAKRKYGTDPDKIPPKVRAWFANHIYCRNKSTWQPIRVALCITLVLVILRLALLLIEDPIQLTDLLRWIDENRLSCFRAQKFLPDNGYIQHTDLNLTTRHHFITVEMRRITQLLNIQDIPVPNLYELVARYAYELCLPTEFVEFTKKIMALFPPQLDYPYFNSRTFPDYEGRAMAYIVFVFRLLFSLDDVTEKKQTEFANAANKSTRTGPPLFSWTGWMRYIECRKAVLSKYDVSMNNLCESKISVCDNVLLNYWDAAKPLKYASVSDTKVPPDVIAHFKKTVEELQEKDVENEDTKAVIVNFPSSLTPFRTYTQHLIHNHPKLLSDRSYRVLSTDFSSHSIRYLVDPAWAITVGNEFHVNVLPVYKTAVEEMKIFEEPKSNIPKASKRCTTPAHIPTPVVIVNDNKRNKSDNRSEEFFPEFRTFDPDFNAENEHGSNFQLNYPSSEYWLFHYLVNSTADEKFKKYSRESLSATFSWLLRECSRIIRCDEHTLYEELAVVEFAYTSLFSDDHEYYQHAHFITLPNEW